MARFVCCFLLITNLFINTVNAQFSKGMRMSGATIGTAFFNAGATDYSVPFPTSGYTVNTNSLGASLTPNYGWFVSDRIVLGPVINIAYKYDKTLKSDEADVTYYKNVVNSFNLSVGAFARNYFSPAGSFNPFVQALVSAGFGSSNHEGYNYSAAPIYKEVFKGKSSGDFLVNAGLAAGVTKLLNQNVGLDIMASYNYTYNKNEYDTNTDRDVDIDGTIDEQSKSNLTMKARTHAFMIGVGLQVFLGKR